MPRGSWTLYLMLIPGLLWILCFRLMPLAGIQIAFRDYNLFTGGGPWVGLKYFELYLVFRYGERTRYYNSYSFATAYCF